MDNLKPIQIKPGAISVPMNLECPRCRKAVRVVKYLDVESEIFSHRCRYYGPNGRTIEFRVSAIRAGREIQIWKIVWGTPDTIVERG